MFTKICSPKYADYFCSKNCQFGITWPETLTECTQARQINASQLFQVVCQRADQRHLM